MSPWSAGSATWRSLPASRTFGSTRFETETSSGLTASTASPCTKAGSGWRADMAKRKSSDDEDLASSGHSLGQKVGDWLEEFFVLPLLRQVADQLKLFLDNLFRPRQ